MAEGILRPDGPRPRAARAHQDGGVRLGELRDTPSHQGASHVVEALEAADVEEEVEPVADAGVHEVPYVADDEVGVVEPVAPDGDVDGLTDVVDPHGVPPALDEELGVPAAATAEVEGAPEAVRSECLFSLEEVLERRLVLPARPLPRDDPGAICGGVADAHMKFLTCVSGKYRSPATVLLPRLLTCPAARVGPIDIL